MRVHSPVFPEGGQLPSRYTKNGENLSPPIAWDDLPEKTRELAVVFEQFGPASGESYVHWLAYGIPSERRGLPEGFKHKRDPKLPADIVQGRNSIGNVGYDGPVGTTSRNLHFRFHIFALDEPLCLEEGAGREELMRAMEGHLLDHGELRVDYQRKD